MRSAPGGRRAGSRALPVAEGDRVAGEARPVVRLGAAVVAADPQRATDEHEAVAVRDRRGWRRVVGPGDVEAVAQESGHGLARPDHEEPAVTGGGSRGEDLAHLRRAL